MSVEMIAEIDRLLTDYSFRETVPVKEIWNLLLDLRALQLGEDLFLEHPGAVDIPVLVH